MIRHWSFGAKVLSTFLALSILVMLITIASALSSRSLRTFRRQFVTAQALNLADAEELMRLQNARLSELRAYILTHSPGYAREVSRTKRDFESHLRSLSARDTDPADREVLARVRADETQYDNLLNEAMRDPSKMASLMERVVQPSRVQLEASIQELHSAQRRKMAAANSSFDKQELSLLRTMAFLTAFEVLLFLALGWSLLKVVAKQKQNWNQVQLARDTLQRAERRAALLARSGKIVTETSNPSEALAQLADLATEWLSNCCLIELTGGAGNLRPTALAMGRTDREELLRSLHQNLPRGLGSLFSTSQVLQTGLPILQPVISDPKLAPLGINSFIALPLRARGRILGVVLIFRTDGPPYEDNDLRFAQELGHQTALSIDNARLLTAAEEGLRMREELLSTVAHDLKNPLTNVRINSELLLKHLPTGSERDIQKQATSIADASTEMERLIHDLLDLTKIESGRIALERHPNDADELISSCLKIFEPQAREQGIELVKEARHGEAIVDCDRNRVLQVLTNLVGNGIKFVGKKGGRVRIEAQATGEGVRFSIIDNGPGIPAEQLPHIFERYWQSGRALTGSTGLGLSIARGIVEAHGGRIWVESALQIGSRFFFTLPEARKQAVPRAA